MTTLIKLLKEKYAHPEWAFIEEMCVGNFDKRIDAAAVNLWASRGFMVIGFEIKHSRSDWLVELQQPAKADPAMSNCHYWYLVTPDKNIIKEGELPPNWGHISCTAKGDKLKVIAPAPRLEPKLNRSFMTGIIRKCVNDIENSVKEKLSTEHDKLYTEIKQLKKDNTNYANKLKIFDEQSRAIKSFETETGVSIDFYRTDLRVAIEAIKFRDSIMSRIKYRNEPINILEGTIKNLSMLIENLKGLSENTKTISEELRIEMQSIIKEEK